MGSRNPQAYYAELTDERILGYCRDCVQIMNEIGYDIKGVDWRVFRSTRTYGLAYKKFNTIVLNQELTKEEESAVKNTILHELAHLAAPAGAHHGPDWQWVCEKIRVHTGQVISRTNPFSQHTGVEEFRNKKVKYEFECPGCRSHITYTRATRFVKEYDQTSIYGGPKWWCSKCKKETGQKVPFKRIR